MFGLKTRTTPAASADGNATQTVRQKAAELEAQIRDIEERKVALAGTLQASERRLADITATRAGREQLLRRAAQGENVPAPTAHQLSEAIWQQAHAESEVEATRQRVQAETADLEADLTRLRQALHDAQGALGKAQFADALIRYREAIAPAIPLALQRAAAADRP